MGAGLQLMLARIYADSLPELHVYGHCDQHQHLVTSSGRMLVELKQQTCTPAMLSLID